MDFVSVEEIAKKWQISERSVRNYCANNRIDGAILDGKTWLIPADAKKPERINQKDSTSTLLEILRQENKLSLRGGIYHKVQIELTYNSNHIEGSRLTEDQTRYIFETNTVGFLQKFKGVRADDVVETANHFRCVDYIIDNANRQISEHMIKSLHLLLKNGTSDSREDWFNVGEYKKLPNEVGGMRTTLPEEVAGEMAKLISGYRAKKSPRLRDLLDFHQQFELIHPFQDGNGRVGRLILFKECLRLNIIPFIIDEDLKMFYYRGLREWWKEPGFLMETCKVGQDKFLTYLDYFQIKPGERG
ncbi:Fic family protein [Candidatus Saccharibacteria bacterium]|nr:Fic family protein [Candidatus Saccharibacteria bacterium]